MAGILEVAAALALIGSSPVPAVQEDPQSVDRLEEVTVEGRLAERARTFIQQVSRPPAGQALARWNKPVCMGVANMRPDAAQVLIDRMSTVAAALGVEPEEPGCKPDVLVVVATSGDATSLIARALDEQEFEFRPSRNGTDLGAAALDDFVNSTAPVRWWHVSLPVEAQTGRTAIALPGEETAPSINIPDASRLHSPIRNDLARVIIMVDAERLGSTSVSALSNYVAMVALAQVDPAFDTAGVDSILNLFKVPGHSGQMTDWDAAFLVSLYRSRSNPSGSAPQERELARAMASALSGDEATD